MSRKPALTTRIVLAGLLSALGPGSTSFGQLPLSPNRDSGLSVTAAYEGWFRNDDGSYSLLIGYFNRNHEQVLDIQVGADNRFEPGDPDRGQPTHFLPRRNWGVFAVRVPKEFAGSSLSWVLTANDETTEIPMKLDPLWEVEPWKDGAQGNTPPTLRLTSGGETFQGPPEKTAAHWEAKAGEPLQLDVWADDDDLVDAYRRARKVAKVRLFWSKYRGPGSVLIENDRPEPDFDNGGLASTTATFEEPGDYILRLQANDVSGDGGGGAQCCWTNAHIRVTVSPVASHP